MKYFYNFPFLLLINLMSLFIQIEGESYEISKKGSTVGPDYFRLEGTILNLKNGEQSFNSKIKL